MILVIDNELPPEETLFIHRSQHIYVSMGPSFLVKRLLGIDQAACSVLTAVHPSTRPIKTDGILD
jgi:hypothetical protein